MPNYTVPRASWMLYYTAVFIHEVKNKAMQPIRFLHISDTHFGAEPDFIYHGKNPYEDALALLQEIQSLPATLDFIIHTGDVVSFQSEQAYALAAKTLQPITTPIYFTTGNHDDPVQLNRFPLFAVRTPLVQRDDAVSYYFERNGVLFIGIDAKNPDNEDPSGIISQDQLDALDTLLATTHQSYCIFTHFPLLPIDAPWMDRHLLVSNGRAAHEIIKKHQQRCRGIFFGHIHQKVQIYQDGVLYCSVPSNTFQFGGWPTDEKISYNPSGKPGMNLVTLTDSGIIIKSVGFERSSASCASKS